MIRKGIMDKFDEIKKKMQEEKSIADKFREIKKDLRPDYKFRNSHIYMEIPLHTDTFSNLLWDADKKTIMEVIKGIYNEAFADTAVQRSAEAFALRDIIKDNIHDSDIVSASFNVMESMLNSAVDSIRFNNKKEAVSEVSTVQNIVKAIAELYDEYPRKLGEQTDKIYETYKNMMKEYYLSGVYSDKGYRHSFDVEDYYFGRDAYKVSKANAEKRRQVNEGWETHELGEAEKIKAYNEEFEKESVKQIAEYEKRHAEQVKKEDSQYKQELKDFAAEHINRVRNKEHQKQINEIKLKHNDKLLEAAYDNFKDVARKPKEDDKSEKLASNDVPKRAAYIGRGKPRQ